MTGVCDDSEQSVLLQNLSQCIINLIFFVVLCMVAIHFVIKLWCQSQSNSTEDHARQSDTNLDDQIGIAYKVLLSITIWTFVITVGLLGLAMLGCLVSNNNNNSNSIQITAVLLHVIGGVCLITSFLVRLNQTFQDTPFAYNKIYYYIIIVLAIIISILGIIGTILEETEGTNTIGIICVITSFVSCIIMTILILSMFASTLHRISVSLNENKRKVSATRDSARLLAAISKYTLLLGISLFTTLINFICVVITILDNSQTMFFILLLIWSIDSVIDGVCVSLIFEFNQPYFELVCSHCRDLCQKCLSQKYIPADQVSSQLSMQSISGQREYDSPRDRADVL